MPTCLRRFALSPLRNSGLIPSGFRYNASSICGVFRKSTSSRLCSSLPRYDISWKRVINTVRESPSLNAIFLESAIVERGSIVWASMVHCPTLSRSSTHFFLNFPHPHNLFAKQSPKPTLFLNNTSSSNSFFSFSLSPHTSLCQLIN